MHVYSETGRLGAGNQDRVGSDGEVGCRWHVTICRQKVRGEIAAVVLC